MTFALICRFAPGAYAQAKQLRLEHYAFLREQGSAIEQGGPLLDAEQQPAGMLMIVTMPDIAAARRFIAGEPYNAHAFFESVEIRAWSHVIPEPHPGFIEEQYQTELRARNQ